MQSYRTVRLGVSVRSLIILLIATACTDTARQNKSDTAARGGAGSVTTSAGSGGVSDSSVETGTEDDSNGGVAASGGTSTSSDIPNIGGSVAIGGSSNTGATETIGGSVNAGGTTVVAVPRPDANVRVTEPAQVIDGFGVSTAWKSQPEATIRSTVYDALFSLSKGAGLSILRNRIPLRERSGMDDQFIAKDSNGAYVFTTAANGAKTFSLNWSNWDLNSTSGLISAILAKGEDYDVTQFMSTPWTPPNNSVSRWKLPSDGTTLDYENTPDVGGYLDPTHYADYADLLADYVLGYQAKMGVELDVLSLQNEPNWRCNYESADWTAAQFHDFITILKAEFAKKGVLSTLPNLKLMMPEFANVNEALALPTLADNSTADVINLIGVHQYEFGPKNVDSYSPPLLMTSLNSNKRIWMTEYNTSAWPETVGMDDALILARLIHMDLAIACMSAFNYWWSWGSGNGFLVQINGTTITVPKRTSALGQFSRFIRPGWRRVTTTTNPSSNVYLSAYKNAADNQIAVVVINTATTTISLPIILDIGQFGALTHYRTSSADSLSKVGTLPAGATANATIDGLSVNTFVGALIP